MAAAGAALMVALVAIMATPERRRPRGRQRRLPGLSGSARSDADHPATDVLRPTIEGAVAAFG
jgi:hypothetical protein